MRKAFFVGLVLSLAVGMSLAMGPVAHHSSATNQAWAGEGWFPSVERVALERATGQPSFVHGDLGQLPRGPVGKAAVNFMQSVAPAFKLGVSDDLRAARSFRGSLGMTHVRLQQYHRGLPVDGGDVVLHVDGRGIVRTINGHLGADIHEAPVPTISGDRAIELFKQRWRAKQVSVESEPRLVYYTRADQPATLAWRSDLRWSDEAGTYLERVYVDATNGTVLDRQSLIWSARYRKIYTANNGTTLPGTLMFSEGGSSSDTVAMAAYTNFGHTYDFYSSVFSRDSYDNAGATLIGTVHYSSNYNNAYWNGTQMVFGDGDGTTFSPLSEALDVVAHELTHAVTSSTANLNYSNESGALNEATSDILGASCEEWVAGSVSANTWKIGEDIYTPGTPGDALRYMNDPAADGQSSDYYPTRYTGTQDNGGVHTNSGIANLAFYLMSQGGTHPRNKTSVVVPALGIVEARAIWYRALTVYMTSTTDFQGARNATAQAAQDLYGSSAYDAVHKAWDAVAVPGTPVTVTTLSNGQTVTNISGASGSWTYYKITVPSGQSSLEIQISGGTGDCDLYVKLGSQPSSSSYDYRPYLSGNNETVTVTSPAAGDWYIGLNGYQSYSGVSLQATYASSSGGGGVTALSSGVPVSNLSGATGADDFYKITVPSGQSSLEIKISGGSGDCDLYVKFGSQPTTSSYDYRPYLNGNNETVTVTDPSAGDWYIMLHGYQAYSGVTLQATYAASGGGGTPSERLSDGTFEGGLYGSSNTGGSGTTGPWSWTSSGSNNPISQSSTKARAGSWLAWLNGYGSTETDTLQQTVAIPSNATSASFSFYLQVVTNDGTTTAYDKLTVTLIDGSGASHTLAVYSNKNAATSGYVQKSFDVLAYAGQTVTLKFTGAEDVSNSTSFYLDDVSLMADGN